VLPPEVRDDAVEAHKRTHISSDADAGEGGGGSEYT
jgi:hypothetical protein